MNLTVKLTARITSVQKTSAGTMMIALRVVGFGNAQLNHSVVNVCGVK